MIFIESIYLLIKETCDAHMARTFHDAKRMPALRQIKIAFGSMTF